MSYLTQPLNSLHRKKDFTCDKKLLDDYFQNQAKQDVKRKLSVCFVLADKDNKVKGYYTLSSTSVNRALLPEKIIRKLPPSYHNLPATLLGRLAIHNAHKGQKLGELLLIEALKRSYDISANNIGSMAVIVDPIDNDAIQFYSKYGFILLPDSKKMFITMESIAGLFA